MPRSNWKGVISFGLVSIPIFLFPSENKEADISFHQIDKRDNARIKYQRVNSNTGKIVPWEQITRGYEYDKETTIPVPDDVLNKVAGENARTVDIKTFVDKKELNILTIDRNYYAVPNKGGDKGYVILRDALRQANKIGIAKVIISTKEYLAAVVPYENALVISLLKYDNEVKKLSEFDFPAKELKAYKVNKKEIEMAKKLIHSMSSKWHPEKYKDEYQKALHTWVEQSANKLPHTITKHRAHARSNVVNFVDLLRKSLSTNKKYTKITKKSNGHLKLKSKQVKHVTKH